MNARRWAALAAVVVSSSIAGCACDENPSASTCTPGSVQIEAPADFAATGSKVTVDEDPAVEGVQVTLEATATGIPSTNSFAVVVNGHFLEALVGSPDADGKVRIEGVTLSNGNNQLGITTIQCDQPVSDTVGVVVDLGGACTFVRPTDGEALDVTDDLDLVTEGLQLDVAVRCADAADGATGRLSVDGAEVGSTAFASGDATFTGVTLPAGAVALSLSTPIGSATAAVTVDLTPQEIALGIPALLGAATDADADTAGLQTDARVVGTALTDGMTVNVVCSGGVTGSAVAAGGEAIIRLSFDPAGCDGESFTCEASVEGNDLLVSNGATIRADDEAPVLVFEQPSAFACGLEPAVVVRGTCLSDGTTVTLDHVLPNDGLETIGPDRSATGGVVAWAEGDLAGGVLSDGSQTFVARATDDAGNEGSVSLAVYIDALAPVPAFTAPLDGATLAGAADLDPVAEGYQADVTLAVAERDGVLVELVARSGATEIARYPAVPVAGGVATFSSVTLPDDAFTLEAIANDGCASGAASIAIVVDSGRVRCNVLRPVADLRTGSPDITVEVESSVLEGAPILVTGVDPAGGAITYGTFQRGAGATDTFTITLGAGDGAYGVDVACGTTGDAVDRTVFLDTTAPVLDLAVDSRGTFVNGLVADADPLRAGLQVAVELSADAIDDGSTGSISVACADGSTDTAAVTFTGNLAAGSLTVVDGTTCTFDGAATDGAGNAAAAPSVPVAVDLVAPVLGNCTPNAGARVGTPITARCLVAGGSVGDAFELLEGGTVFASGTLASATQLVSGPHARTDGPYAWTARVIDAAGNPVEATLSFVADGSVPSLTLAVDSVGGFINGTIADANGARAGLQVGFTLTADAIEDGQTGTVTSTCSNGANDSVVVTFAGNVASGSVSASEGAVCTFGGSATDVAGNVATVVPPVVLVVDQTPVAFGACTPDGGGKVPVPVTLRCLLTGGTVGDAFSVRNGATSLDAGALANASELVSLPLALADGSYTLTASVTDAAGNPAQATVTFVADGTAPAVVISADNTLGYVNAATVDADPARAGMQIAVALAADSIDDGSTGTLSVSCTDGSSDTATVTFAANAAATSLTVADGASCTFSLLAQDAAGNAAVSSPVTVLVDRQAPVLTSCSPDAGEHVGVPFTVQCLLTGGTTGDTFQVFNGAALFDSGTLGTPTQVSSGPHNVADGAYTFSVRVTDAAGNTGSRSASLVADSTVPSLTLSTTLVGGFVNASIPDADAGRAGMQIAVALTADDIVDGTAATISVACTDGFTESVPVTFTALAASATLTVRDHTTCTISATATDLVGRVSNAPNLVAGVDVSIPAVGPCTPVADTRLASPFTLTCQVAGGVVGDTWAVLVGGAPFSSGTLTAATSFTSGPHAHADGTIAWTASVTDAAGNRGETTGSFIVDSSAPLLTLVVDSRTGWVNTLVADASAARPGKQVLVTLNADLIEDGRTANISVACTGGATDSATPTFTGNVATAALTVIDGQNCTFSASATDTAGNAGTAANVTVGVDLVAPAVSSCTPTGGAIASSPITLRCTISGVVVGDRYEVVEAGSVFASGSLASAVQLVSGPHAHADGPVAWTARVFDAAGNPGLQVTAFTATSAAPAVTVTTPAAGAMVSRAFDFNAATPQIDANVVVSTTALNAGSPLYICSSVGAGPACPGGGFQIDAQVFSTTAGPATVRPAFGCHVGTDVWAVVVDPVAGVVASPRPHAVTYDVRSPSVLALDLLDDANGDGILNAAALAAGGGAVRLRAMLETDPADACANVEGRTVTFTIGAASVTAAVVGGVAGPVAVVLGDGSHTVNVSLTDAAGNANTSVTPTVLDPEAQRSFSVDAVPPTIAWQQPSGCSTTASPLLEVTSNAGAGATVTFREGATTLCTGTVDGTGRASCTPGAPLAQGARTLAASVADVAGNPATASTSFSVDSIAPTATFTAPLAGQSFPNIFPVAISLNVTGLAPGAGVPLTISNAVGTQSATVNGAGTVAAASLSLDPGAGITITAIPTDACGNSAVVTSGAFDVQNTGCTLSMLDHPNASHTFGAAQDEGAAAGVQFVETIQSDCVGRTVSVTIGGGAPVTGVIGAGGTVDVPLTLADPSTAVLVEASITSIGGLTTTRSFLATADTTPATIDSTTPAGDFSVVAASNGGIDGATVIADLSAGVPATADLAATISGGSGGSLALEINGFVVGTQAIVGSPATLSFNSVSLTQNGVDTIRWLVTDAVGNTSSTTRTATVDVLAPLFVGNLTMSLADRRAATLRLAFAAPAEDDATGTGTATSYEIRYVYDADVRPVAFAYDVARFLEGALAEGVPVPAAAGAAESIDVSVNPLATGYKACVRAYDSVGNTATLCALAPIAHGWSRTEYAAANTTQFGFQVLAVGDVGQPGGGPDGYPDFAVAEPGFSANAGRITLFFGGTNLAALSSTTLVGGAGDGLGARMSYGDFDGDGINDLVVGARRYGSLRGRTYIYWGGTGGFDAARVLELRNDAAARSQFGRTVANIGDIGSAAAGHAADGIDDLLIGAYDESVAPVGPGRAYIYFGRSRAEWEALRVNDEGTGPYVPVSVTAGPDGLRIAGDANGDGFSFRPGARSVGDLDSDGIAEVVVSASRRGRLYLFDGQNLASAAGTTLVAGTSAIQLLTAPTIRGTTLSDDYYGSATIGGSDLTGDGYPDLVVSDGDGRRVYVSAGNTVTHDFEGYPDHVQMLEDPMEYFVGGSSGGYGWDMVHTDITGDGRPDLLVGCNNTSSNFIGVHRGLSMVGGATVPFQAPHGRLTGGSGNFGIGLATADLDADGDAEVIVSATGIGRVFVYTP